MNNDKVPYIEIYGMNTCTYCIETMTMLQKEKRIKFDYKYYDVSELPSVHVDKTSYYRCTPKVFVNGIFIGGYTNLKAFF